MNTDFGTKLQAALDAKNKDINSFIWKDENSKSVRLMDMSQDDLKTAYKHCYEMLFNTDHSRVGKVLMKENVRKCWSACNTELFVRSLYTMENSQIHTNKELLDYINLFKKEHNLQGEDSISTIFDNLDYQFKSITINDLLNACFDRLGIVNRKIVTNQFIYSIGIWLTDAEFKDLTEYENGKLRNRCDVIKERLFIAPAVYLKSNSEGLSYAELRALIQMNNYPKISSLPTIALNVLRDKVLILLETTVDYHINKWQTLLNNIKSVAEYKNWRID